ncbi:MAG: hypothetical protein JXR18_05730 [Neptuniibacter sp.]
MISLPVKASYDFSKVEAASSFGASPIGTDSMVYIENTYGSVLGRHVQGYFKSDEGVYTFHYHFDEHATITEGSVRLIDHETDLGLKYNTEDS